MELTKLKILVEKNFPTFQLDKPIEVLFNPNQIKLSKTGWRTGSNGNPIPSDTPATLSMTLFFDTSLINAKSRTFDPTLVTPVKVRKAPDVRKYTKEIYQLTQNRSELAASGEPRPPVCRLVWGLREAVFFQGVLVSLTKNFTRFLEDGTPIRATLECSFQAWEAPETEQRAKNPIDDPIHIVKRGETLSSIAAQEYNDPSLWRVIAITNRLSNPRAILPGQLLTIPPLRR
jgi:hypothetical protein